MKRLAIILHGGIGTGDYGQGYPMLERLLQEFGREFELVVFSLSRPAPGFVARGFQLVCATGGSDMLRWLNLARRMVRAHRMQGFHALVAFWGFPAGLFATLLGKVIRVPTVVSLMGGDATGIREIDFGIMHRKWKRFLARWAYQNCNQLVALTAYQAKEVSRAGISRVPVVIPWGTEENQITFSEKKFTVPLRLIHVGHLTPVKDQETLLKAIAQLHKQTPCRLTVLGGDSMGGRIQAYCHELGLNEIVKFEGLVPYSAINEWLQRFDILLLTSRYEGQCMAVVEAAAAGLLLAGTRVGQLYDLGDEGAVLVEPGQWEKLAASLLEVLHSHEGCQRRIAYAKSWADAHPLRETARAWIALIHDTTQSQSTQFRSSP